MKKEYSNVYHLSRVGFALPVALAGMKAAKIVMSSLGIRRSLGVRLIELSVGMALSSWSDKQVGKMLAATIEATIKATKDHFFEKGPVETEFDPDQEELREDMIIRAKMMKEDSNG